VFRHRGDAIRAVGGRRGASSRVLPSRVPSWMFVVVVLIPLIGIMAAVVVPAIARWWQG
jgi:hypothetical protein